MTELPPLDTFVMVPFGEKGAQVAFVVSHTKTGRAKVRPWNRTRNAWMPGFRTISAGLILRTADFIPAIAPPELQSRRNHR